MVPRMDAEKRNAATEQPERAFRRDWGAIAVLATRQGGTVSTAQLRAAGVTRSATRWAVRTGRLFPAVGRTYRVGHSHEPLHDRMRNALVSVGPRAVLSHRSAAVVWGLMTWNGRPDVTAPFHARDHRRIVIHQGKLRPREEVTHRKGFPVTTVRRTLIDLAAVLSRPRLKAVVHEAATKGWLDARTVRKLHHEMFGRRGARTLRALIVERDVSAGRTRSTLETAFAALVVAAGLPAYERGMYIDIGGGDIRECDAVWCDRRVMVELDFLPLHETGFVPYRDRRRDRRLAASGWVVIRLTGDDLEHHRAEVIRDLRSALRLTQKRDAAV